MNKITKLIDMWLNKKEFLYRSSTVCRNSFRIGFEEDVYLWYNKDPSMINIALISDPKIPITTFCYNDPAFFNKLESEINKLLKLGVDQRLHLSS